MTSPSISTYDTAKRQFICRGEWDISSLPQLQKQLQATSWPNAGAITIDGAEIAKMDSAGAWLINQLQSRLQEQGLKVDLQRFSKEGSVLLNLVAERIKEEVAPAAKIIPNWAARFGKHCIGLTSGLNEYLAFIGKLTEEALRIAAKPTHLRWGSIAGVIFRNGFQALPIIALLSFMIGVVITFQMGLQLRNYGANIFIVDLLGLSILREFGPLLTAIMVAGRTGSAFTAQLGMMKINQEIDALDTMGVTPAELLLIPRIIGLFIALTLLTMWSDIFGVFGGMVMSNNMLSISWYDFMHRFPQVIPLRAFLIGIGKAPIFALIIASIGCFQGVQVGGSADSVGRNTTRSVVMAIFFIIVADAVFSVIFSKLKL